MNSRNDLQVIPQNGHGCSPVTDALLLENRLITLDAVGTLIFWDLPSGKQYAGVLLPHTLSKRERDNPAEHLRSTGERRIDPRQLVPHQLWSDERNLYAFGRGAIFRIALQDIDQPEILPEEILYFGNLVEKKTTLILNGEEIEQVTGEAYLDIDCEHGRFSSQGKHYICLYRSRDQSYSGVYVIPRQQPKHFAWTVPTDEVLDPRRVTGLAYADETKTLSILLRATKTDSGRVLTYRNTANGPTPVDNFKTAAIAKLSPDGKAWFQYLPPTNAAGPRLGRIERITFDDSEANRQIPVADNGRPLLLRYYLEEDRCTLLTDRGLAIHSFFGEEPLSHFLPAREPAVLPEEREAGVADLIYLPRPLALSTDGKRIVTSLGGLYAARNEFSDFNGRLKVFHLAKKGLEQILNLDKPKLKSVQLTGLVRPLVKKGPVSNDFFATTPPVTVEEEAVDALFLRYEDHSVALLEPARDFALRWVRHEPPPGVHYVRTAVQPEGDGLFACIENQLKKDESKAIQVFREGHPYGPALPLEQLPDRLAFSHTGDELIALYPTGLLQFWSVDRLTEEPLRTLQLPLSDTDRTTDLRFAFHPSQDHVAVAQTIDRLLVSIHWFTWQGGEVESVQETEIFQRPECGPHVLEFSETGRFLAFRSDGLARLWIESEEKETTYRSLDLGGLTEAFRDEKLAKGGAVVYGPRRSSPCFMDQDRSILLEIPQAEKLERWATETLLEWLALSPSERRRRDRPKPLLTLSTAGLGLKNTKFQRFRHRPFLAFYRDQDEWIRLYDYENQEWLPTIYPLGRAHALLVNSDNYYCSGALEEEQIAFRLDGALYPMAQFDLIYNRPDTVMAATRLLSPDRAELFTEAQDKRIDTVVQQNLRATLELVPGQLQDELVGHLRQHLKDRLLADPFQMPEVGIVGKETLAGVTKERAYRLKVRIRQRDSKEKLLQFNLYLNGVPIYGRQGIPMLWAQSGAALEAVLELEPGPGLHVRSQTCLGHGGLAEFVFTLTFPLTVGFNRIEATIENADGITGSDSFFLNYEPTPPPVPQLHFIGIGIGRHQQSDKNLDYPTKDIAELQNAFGQLAQSNADYEDFHALLSTAEDPDRNSANFAEIDSFLAACREHLLTKSRVDDRVVIAYAGHGLHNQEKELVLSTWDTDFTSYTNTLPYRRLEELIDGIPARNRLILLDACNSGAVDSLGNRKTVGDHAAGEAVRQVYELMHSRFGPGRQLGATVITAAKSHQSALEAEELKNGVFTHFLLSRLRDRQAPEHLSAISDHLSAAVPEFIVAYLLEKEMPELAPPERQTAAREIATALRRRTEADLLPLARHYVEQQLGRLDIPATEIPKQLAEKITKHLQTIDLRSHNRHNDWQL